MPPQNLFNTLKEQQKPERLLELRLAAFRLSRTIGSPARVSAVACLMQVPLIIILYNDTDRTLLPRETLTTAITFGAILVSIVIYFNEMVIKTLASQITIKDVSALDMLADSGNSEAAFCVATLHAKRGADAHEFMWLERAAGMGHRKAARLLAKHQARRQLKLIQKRKRRRSRKLLRLKAHLLLCKSEEIFNLQHRLFRPVRFDDPTWIRRVGLNHLNLGPVDYAMVLDMLNGFKTHVVPEDHQIVAVMPGVGNQDRRWIKGIL